MLEQSVNFGLHLFREGDIWVAVETFAADQRGIIVACTEHATHTRVSGTASSILAG